MEVDTVAPKQWYYCEYCWKENQHHWKECAEIQDWCGLCEHFSHLWQKCPQPGGIPWELVDKVPVREEEEQLQALKRKKGRSGCPQKKGKKLVQASSPYGRGAQGSKVLEGDVGLAGGP
ncbi:UNVERIFIED_CONTAM: hypothetical protein FKN15_020954 [Acipenser sinensis]